MASARMPPAMEAARWYTHDTWRRVYDRLEGWVETAERWASRWIGASVLSEQVLHLTSEQLHSLQDDLVAVVDRYRTIADNDDAPSPDDARAVQVAFMVFPLGETLGSSNQILHQTAWHDPRTRQV